MARHVKLSPAEAKEKVAALRKIVLDTYGKEVKYQPFFKELRAGTLSRERLKECVGRRLLQRAGRMAAGVLRACFGPNDGAVFRRGLPRY
jgi:hypothetical protein